MKIKLLSDLHLDMKRHRQEDFLEELDEEPNKVDLLVLAGDITYGLNLSKTLTEFCKRFEDVIFCFGNHELYLKHYQLAAEPNVQMVYDEVDIALNLNKNLHFLDNSFVEIKGQRFLGTPLWYKKTQYVYPDKRVWSDFIYIPGADPWIFNQNTKALKFLDNNLRENDIVVSHMLPSQNSVDPKYLGSPDNKFFVCDVHDLIVERKPKMWFHGHTHMATYYTINETEVFCNPLGYDFAGEKSGYNSNLIIDV